jgi:hypothetical protein
LKTPFVCRGGHASALEDSRIKLNQIVFKIYNQTELCVSFEPNRTELLKWFGFMILNQTITNFPLKIELFQFDFKTIDYGSILFGGSVWFFSHPLI